MSWIFKLVNQFEAHGNYVLKVQFLPEKPMLATAGMDGVMKLWSYPNWEPLASLAGHENSVNDFLPLDGDRYLISASTDKTIRKWNTRSKDQLWKIDAHKKTVSALALHPDEKTFASGSYDGKVKLWNAETGEPLAACADFGKNVSALLFLPGTNLLACAGLGEEILIWDTATAEVVKRLPGHGEAVYRLFYAPREGSLITTGTDHKMRQWNTQTWEVAREVELPASGVFPVALTRDETLMAVGCEKRVLLFSYPEMNLLTTLNVEPKGVYSLDFSNDGNYLVLGAANRQLYIWQMLDTNANIHGVGREAKVPGSSAPKAKGAGRKPGQKGAFRGFGKRPGQFNRSGAGNASGGGKPASSGGGQRSPGKRSQRADGSRGDTRPAHKKGNSSQ